MSLEGRSKLQKVLSTSTSQRWALQSPKALLLLVSRAWVTDAQGCLVTAGHFQKTFVNCKGFLGEKEKKNTEFSAKGKSTFCRNPYFSDTCSLHPRWGVLRGECCRAQPSTSGEREGHRVPQNGTSVNRWSCAQAMEQQSSSVPRCLWISCPSRWLMLSIHREASNTCDPARALWCALSLNEAFQPQTTDFMWIRLIIKIIVSLRVLLVGWGPVSASSAGSSAKVQRNELCWFSATMLSSCRYSGWIEKVASSAWNLLQEGK